MPLRQLSSFAKEYDVKIDEMIPQPIDPDSIVKNEDGKYLGQDIFIKGQAGYHEFGAFLNRIERENIFWIVEDLCMTEEDDSIYRHVFKMKIKLILLEKA